MVRINFDLEKAAIFQAVKWSRHAVFRFAKPLKRVFLTFFILAFLIFLLGLSEFGLSILFLTLAIFCQIIELFFNSKLKRPKISKKLEEALSHPEEINFAEFLNFEAAKSVWGAIKFSKKKKLSQVPSEALLYFSLREIPEINFIFSRALLNLKGMKRELKNYLDSLMGEETGELLSLDSQKVIFEAGKIAQRRQKERIGIGDILVSQSVIDPIFKKNLIEANLKVEDIENISWWFERLSEEMKERKRFWEWKNLIRRGSLAKDWAAGYTLTLDKFSTDWTEIIRRRGFREIVGLKKEVEETERILARQDINNVLLIGDPGVRRMTIVHELTRKALFNLSLPQINQKRIVSLDIGSVISASPQTNFGVGAEGAEIIFDTIFKEVISAGNVILVIDDFHNYVGQSRRPGVIDISGIIAPYLQLSQFQIIAITDFPGLHKFIEPNLTILNLFEKVEISEISEKETIMILEDLTPELERKYKLFISYPPIKAVVKYSDRYLPATPFPKKAIDLLDETVVYASYYLKTKVVLPEHVERVISAKTQIPIGEIETKEREILLNLESLIHQRIINQEEAVKEVSTALRRARADITIRKGPMGCFLFLGPTGVGKTETSKALAEIYFGSEEKMIRLDMSEFQAIEDIPRLIGSEGEEGLLTTPVRENPFSLILLDEFEKAHPNILNLFLQVFDEGHLTDGLGRKVDFKNSIIIATSNAGYQIILEAIKSKMNWSGVKEKLLDFLFQEAIFRPELINRFDAVVVFRPLTKENLLAIAELLLSKLKKNLQEKEIEFRITKNLKEKIVELGYNPIFGAREMRRVIQDKIENILASAILRGEIKRGDKVEIDPQTFQIKR